MISANTTAIQVRTLWVLIYNIKLNHNEFYCNLINVLMELEATQNRGTSWWATRSLMPGCPRLVVWLEFLVTNILLIWNVRWAIKLQSAQLKVVYHTEAKWLPWFFRGFQFLCRRENSVYQLFLGLGYNKFSSKHIIMCTKNAIIRPVLYLLLDLLRYLK